MSETYVPEYSIRDVDLTLGGAQVLKDVCLTLPKGVTALVGQNGAGKTSLLRVVAGSTRPDRGAVIRAGHDIWSASGALTEHRRHLGWLPQEPGLPPRMTVQAFLDYAAWLKKLDVAVVDTSVASVIEKFDLLTVRQRPLGKLSGGQRRRAALGAAVIAGPSLLLLDEPTNGLDPVQRRRFLDLVQTIAPHTSVLMSTHMLEDVTLAADRWCALRSGQVVAAGEVPPGGGNSQTMDEITRAVAGEGII